MAVQQNKKSPSKRGMQSLSRLFKVEVKTTVKEPGIVSLFGDKPFYRWPMNKKHETIADKNLIYCFVYLKKPDDLPLFFVVPSKEVARYVRWQHQHYLKTRKRAVVDSNMRVFRISVDDPDHWKNNWKQFKK